MIGMRAYYDFDMFEGESEVDTAVIVSAIAGGNGGAPGGVIGGGACGTGSAVAAAGIGGAEGVVGFDDGRIRDPEQWASLYEEELLDLYYGLVDAAQPRGSLFDRASFHNFCVFAFSQSSGFPPSD